MEKILKEKFVELGRKGILVHKIGELKDNLIEVHCGNIAKSTTFNNEMETKYGKKARWKFEHKYEDVGHLLNNVPMGIVRLKGTFNHPCTKNIIFKPKKDFWSLLGNIRRRFGPQFRGIKLSKEITHEIEPNNKLKGKVKDSMDREIEIWKRKNKDFKSSAYFQEVFHSNTWWDDDSWFVSSTITDEQREEVKSELKKGFYKASKKQYIETTIYEPILFYKNYYTVLTEDEIKEILLELELKSMSYVSTELENLE